VGNEAYAGFYATQLDENQLLPDKSWLICPASLQAEETLAFYVPTRGQLRRAQGEELARLQRMGGGSYAYSLGVVVNGLHQAPRNRMRSYFPLMADAPSQTRPTGQEPTRNHGGRGYNVLYEDGHVDYVSGSLSDHCYDDPLVNKEGFVEAGRGEEDAVLAPSQTRPLLPRLYYRQ
jgi:prepilin-type processing-associated H-X9-DG protein